MSDRISPWRSPLLCLLLLLTACSAYAPPEPLAGISREEMVARMGQPAMEHRTDAGSRLEFSYGPYGKQTWFVDFDAAGRAVRAEQALTEANFNRISVGMAQDDVGKLLGRPGEVQVLGRARGLVWSYRYDNYLCLWFQVELSLEREVRSASYAQAPECEGPDDRADR